MIKKNEENNGEVGDLGELLTPYFVPIILTAEDMQLAETYGKKVWKENNRVGRRDERSSEENEMAWVASEIAFSKWFGCPYEDPVNKFIRVPDVSFIDVKWTDVTNNGVPLKRNHPHHRPIVSVVGRRPNLILRGWELSHHMKQWGKDQALKNKEEMYDKDDKIIFPWCRLKPMYMLSRNRDDYGICVACDGLGISKNNKPCLDCKLGKVLSENLEAFNQLIRARAFLIGT